MTGRLGSWLGTLGPGLALLSANLAAACCGLIPAVGALAAALGLGVLQYASVQRPVLYVAAGLALLGIGLSTRRHRDPIPLAIAALSVPAVLYPFHVAMNLALFRVSLYGGLGGLILAAVLNLLRLKGRVRTGARSRDEAASSQACR